MRNRLPIGKGIPRKNRMEIPKDIDTIVATQAISTGLFLKETGVEKWRKKGTNIFNQAFDAEWQGIDPEIV